MKWKLIRLFLPLLVIGFVVPQLMPGPDGLPVMSWRDWVPEQRQVEQGLDSVQSQLENLDSLTPTLELLEPKQIYKWQDASGQWHFSDQPQEQFSGVQSQPAPELRNIIPGVSVTPPAAEATGGPAAGNTFFSPTTVPLEQIPQLMEDARNIQKISEDRARQLEQY